MNIETLKLCVQIVDYPQEEIDNLKEENKGLKQKIVAHETQRQKLYKLLGEVREELSKERLLTNETLLTAQHWKNKFEEVLGDYQQVRIEKLEMFDEKQELKQKYEELLVKHAKVLEENTKYEKKCSVVEHIKSIAHIQSKVNNWTHVFCQNYQQMRMLLDTEYAKGQQLYSLTRTITLSNGARIQFHQVDVVSDAYRYCGCIEGDLLVYKELYECEDMIQFFNNRTRPGYTLTLWEN